MSPSRSSPTDGVAIAGGGLAAQRCAETLRRRGFDGRITMICAEPRPPYDRPPLSKQMLEENRPEGGLAYRPEAWYRDHDIDLLLGVRATALDLRPRRISLSSGEQLRYDQLLIATGGRPRRAPVLAGYENVSVLRDLEHAELLRRVLDGRPRLAVVGAGFIGLEIAAAARRRGAAVTVIEAAGNPLESILGPEVGAWFARVHRAEGVEVLTGRTVASVIGSGSVRALGLSDDRVLEVDHVVVGIGTEPDVGWVQDSGLAGPRGVHVDPDGRTVLRGVYAAGDAAATYDPELGRHLAGSHWEAAARQGTSCAHLMLGLRPPPRALSSFWTDQYDLRIQYLGHGGLADGLTFDGDPDSRDFIAVYTRGGRIVAALLVNRANRLPAIRRALKKGSTWPI